MAVALNVAKASKSGKSKVDTKDIKCYNCGKKGNFKSECRKPIKNETNKNESKNDVHEDSHVALHSNTSK
jgi:hypothetical protein